MNDRESEQKSALGELRLACQSTLETDVVVEFVGPVKHTHPIHGSLERSSDGPQIDISPRENSRRALDSELIVSTDTTSSFSQDEMNAFLRRVTVSDEAEIEAGTLQRAPGFGSEEYCDTDYRSARARRKLLYFNVEFTNKCNLACAGCFAGFGDVKNVYDLDSQDPGYRHVKEVEGPLVLEELIDLVDQAADLGAKTVDLIGGGEPLVSEMFFPLAEHAVSRGLEVEVFTNGTAISPAVADRMIDLRILPFVKLYSTRSWIHDEMVGVKGAWRQAVAGIDNLLRAGYGCDGKPRMALESIIVRKNRSDLPTMWRYARDNGMIPYFERFVGCHYDGDPGALLTPRELKDVWEELWLLDRGEYGYTWPLLPLRVGYTCATNFYSLYINYEGQVRPCSGLFVDLGDVRSQSLRDILEKSPVVEDLRTFDRGEDSWCANCYYYESERCPGCRGMAEAAGGYMADDPLCFHNPTNLRGASDPRNSPHLNAPT